MKSKDLAVTAFFFLVAATNLSAASLSVSGAANIFNAGQTSVPAGSGLGQLPPFLSFAPDVFKTLSFSSVTGTVTLDGGGHLNDADGVGSAPISSSTSSLNGISGIIAPHAGYLVGVFLTNSEPTPPAPAILDFTSLGTSFTILSPLINQSFFIGDGLTGAGTGAQQVFNIPATATRLFLGISDAPSYNGIPGGFDDNTGSFTADFALIPEPSVIALQIIGAAAFLVHRIRRNTKAVANHLGYR